MIPLPACILAAGAFLLLAMLLARQAVYGQGLPGAAASDCLPALIVKVDSEPTLLTA